MKTAPGRLAAAAGLALSLAAPGRAEPGATAANFLKIGVGSRPVALGQAFAGLADDANAVAYNPAGLATLRRQELTLMHNEFLAGVRQEWGAYALPTATLGTFAVAGNRVWIRPFDAFDAAGQPAGSVSAADTAVYGAYAKEFGGWRYPLSLGVSAKHLSSRLGGDKAQGWAYDAGVMLKLDWEGHLRVGASLRNVGRRMRFIEEGFDLPRVWAVGASYRWRGPYYPDREPPLLLTVEGLFPNDRDPSVSGGAELQVIQGLALRAGWRGDQDAGIGLSLGIGFANTHMGDDDSVMGLSLDYAFVDFGVLERTHRVSMTLRFGANKEPGRFVDPGNLYRRRGPR